eukprot:5156570-Amphidinium_carterae.2
MDDGYSNRYTAEDSERHLRTEKLKFAEQGCPKRANFVLPSIVPLHGIFPQSWLDDEYPPDTLQGSDPLPLMPEPVADLSLIHISEPTRPRLI